jgi:hypothetical protein
MKAETFIEQWTKSLELGSAGVFIGAGLSVRAGYPTWRSLLADIATELGLDMVWTSRSSTISRPWRNMP